jgi:hypothetical protein
MDSGEMGAEGGKFMFIRFGALLLGVAYTALGLLGFLEIDAINPVHHQGIGARYLLNLIAINGLHNVIHLAVGVTGLLACRSVETSRRWGLAAGTVLLLLFAVGMVQAYLEGFPYDQSLFGIIPLNSPGHFLHLVTGGIALFLCVTPYPRPYRLDNHPSS